VEPRDAGFAAAVAASFARQGMMRHLGAELLSVAPGRVAIAAPVRPETAQQHGFAHAGLTFALGDSAAGYAALSLLGPGEEVLTAEMKLNLLAPARGARLVAEGRVIRPGRRLTVVAADVWAEAGGTRTHVATMLGTLVAVAAGGQ
jgi:uncharacterized protein (TIGR00369 family)